MNQATEIYSREFDAFFFKLPPQTRSRIEDKIRELGGRLDAFPHIRLQDRSEFRLRAGDYRIIYEFDLGEERALPNHFRSPPRGLSPLSASRQSDRAARALLDKVSLKK